MRRGRTFLAAIALLSCGGIAHAGPPEALMERFDLNRDGRIERAEAQSFAARHFARLDSNGDGRVTPDERAAPGAERLMRADRDGDGRVSLEELSDRAAQRTEAVFRKADRDGDGYLSPDELRGAARLGRHADMLAVSPRSGQVFTLEAIEDRLSELFERLDTDRDGVITHGEASKRPAGWRP